jgi:hypothetical protein
MYAPLWKATAALAAAALAVGLVALATTPSDGATPTCRTSAVGCPAPSRVPEP